MYCKWDELRIVDEVAEVTPEMWDYLEKRMDEPTKNRINQIIKSREAQVRGISDAPLISYRDGLIKILKNAGADSHQQLIAVAEIEKLFGIRIF